MDSRPFGLFLSYAPAARTLEDRSDCVKCPEEAPGCACPSGTTCVLTAQSCTQCASVQCLLTITVESASSTQVTDVVDSTSRTTTSVASQHSTSTKSTSSQEPVQTTFSTSTTTSTTHTTTTTTSDTPTPTPSDPSPSSMGVSAPADTTVPTGSHGALSTGAKAAIGVCVPVVIILLVAVILFLWRRRRKISKPESLYVPPDASAPKAELTGKPELDGGPITIRPTEKPELDGQSITTGHHEPVGAMELPGEPPEMVSATAELATEGTQNEGLRTQDALYQQATQSRETFSADSWRWSQPLGATAGHTR